MRILLVVHCFLPRHVAGTELYTARLAQELRKEHEVALFFTERDVTAGSYPVRRGAYEGTPFTEVVNNHPYWRFRETHENARLDEIFASLLDTYQPDVVQVRHLANLSLGCVMQAQRRRIPVVYTLHDYWLTCPRNGLRMKKSGALCYQVVPHECAPCMAATIRHTPPLRRVHQCDVLIAPSRFLRERFIESGVAADKILYLDNGLDLAPSAGVYDDATAGIFIDHGSYA